MIYTFSNENKQVKINSDYKNVEHILMVGSKKVTLQKTLHKFTLFVNHKNNKSYWFPRTKNDHADQLSSRRSR